MYRAVLTGLDKSFLCVPRWAFRFDSPCFRLLPCGKDAARSSLLVASYQYRGHIIRFEVKQNPDALYWEAIGAIEQKSRTFIVKGAINTFENKAEAKRAFLQQAKTWVYDRIGS